ncbi:hypothetical protein DPX16_21676 [Anabarilius grahami]|uniref:Uncharacterized protein n=1 Tax=Anabarilius grahami TaxID=495550 RepID=A0A3N0YJR9_ANAGA|nr:hypothetical protein DPX16_21676 [Anabarilius grahami]
MVNCEGKTAPCSKEAVQPSISSYLQPLSAPRDGSQDTACINTNRDKRLRQDSCPRLGNIHSPPAHQITSNSPSVKPETPKRSSKRPLTSAAREFGGRVVVVDCGGTM